MDMNIDYEPNARLTCWLVAFHPPWPNHSADEKPPPIWKFTGVSRLWHRSQMGSQCLSLSGGRPLFCGSEWVLMPRYPRSWVRLHSISIAFRSHQGIRAIGNMRSPDSRCISAIASL